MKLFAIILILFGAFSCRLYAQCENPTIPYGQIGVDTNRAYKVIATADGNFVVAGGWNSQAYLLKINAQGQQIAFQRYGSAIGGKSSFRDLVETPDGTLVAVGECQQCGIAGDSLSKVVVLKVTANLALDATASVKKLGAVTYPNGYVSRNEQFSPNILRKGNGGYVLATAVSTGLGLNPQDIVFTQLTDNLTITGITLHHTGFFESPYEMVATNDGFLLAINRAFAPQCVLLKLNPAGTALWNKPFTAPIVRGLTWVSGSDEAIVAGARSATAGQPSQQAFAMRFNATTGAMLDSLLWGDALADEAYDIQATATGKLLVAVQQAQPNPFGTYTISRIYHLNRSPLQIDHFQTIPNPDNITNMNTTALVALSADGDDFAAVGIRGFFNRSFFHLRRGCNPPAPVKIFRETYGVMGNDRSEGHKVVSLTDGSCIVGGHWQNFATLTKLNCAGKVLKQSNFAAILGDTSVIKDILSFPDGNLVVTGEVRRSVTGGLRRNRIFAFRCNADFVIDAAIGLKVYDIPGATAFNHNSPDIEPFGNGYALSFTNDFFGGNLHVVTLNQQLSLVSNQMYNHSFIESDPSLAVEGTTLWVAENSYIFGEPAKISLSKYRDDDGDGQPELLWEKKWIGGNPHLLVLPGGQLLLTGNKLQTVATKPQEASFLYRLNPADGTILDSLFFSVPNANSTPTDLRFSPDGSALLSLQYAYIFYNPQAAPVHRVRILPKLAVLGTHYLTSDNEFMPQHIRSVAAANTDGSQLVATGWDNTPLNRMFLWSTAAQTCNAIPIAIPDFLACSSNTLLTPECPNYPLCQPRVIQNVVYRTAKNAKGVDVNLDLDVYLPRTIADNPATLQKRPLMILVHGGGFIFGNEDVYSNAAIAFAQHGFIVASLSYRLGMPNDSICGNSPQEAIRMAYRAMQDTRIAYNFLLTRTAQYHIDPENIYFHGFSAGGFLALSTAFWSNDDLGILGPAVSDLGPLPALNQPLRAIFPMGAPGLLNSSFFDPNEQTITYMIHGTCDETASLLMSTPSCPGWGASAPAIANAQAIHDSGRKLTLHLYKGGGHGFDNPLDEVAVWSIIRAFIKNRVICGTAPQYECLQTDFDLRKPCSAVSCPQIVSASITGKIAVARLQIQPNPTTGRIRLRLPEDFDGNLAISVTILDIHGKTVHTDTAGTLEADLSHLTPGVYWCRVQAGFRTVMERVVLHP